MTANSSAKSINSLFSSVGEWLQSIFRLGGRLALGGLAIIAAGIVAMAMAFLGVLIALAALIMRFTRGSAMTAGQRRQSHAEQNGEDGLILEARKTGEGWTVE